MNVNKFCYGYANESDRVRIRRLPSQEIVFEGTYEEAKFCEYTYEWICSFVVEDGIICIRIE